MIVEMEHLLADKLIERAPSCEFLHLSSSDRVNCDGEEMTGLNPVNDELRNKIHDNVTKFLGGQWQVLSCDDLTVKPLSGGLSNYLYTCSLPEDMDPVNDEPRCVLIRIFGSFLQQEALTMDSVIFALLAEKGLGPRLHGVFPGGRIEEFIPSHCLTYVDLAEPAVSKRLAQLISSFHSLKMPVSRDPSHIFDVMKRFIHDAHTTPPLETNEACVLDKLSGFLNDNDLLAETSWLRTILPEVKSPVVFCHNDIQAGNVLQFNRPDGRFELKMIDFEFARYGYRGFDLANHFCEWTFDNFYVEPPYFRHLPHLFPSPDQQVAFFRVYRETNAGTTGDSDERMLQEVRYFTMLSHLFWSMWAAAQVKATAITFGYTEYAECRFNAYKQLKEQLKDLPIQRFE